MQKFAADKEFLKKVVKIGVPISAQQLITVGVNLMDNIMLGQLGETVLSASTAAVQIHNLFHFMCMGMGMGAAVMISRYWGANDKINLKKAISLMYRFCISIAVIFTLVIGFFPSAIMSLMTNDAAVVAEGVRYLRWALPCFIIYGFSMTTTIVLRNSGKAKIPLYSSLGAFGLNIFFNWVFIFGKLGAPEMGIAGAALGTLISRVFEFCVICGYFVFKDKTIDFRVKDIFLPCRDILKEYIHFSMPVMISDTILGLGNSAVVAVAGHVGTTFMSANSITMVVQQIASVFSSGLGQAALIITGNTLGEGRIEDTRKQGNTLVIIGFVLGILACILIFAISPAIVSLYNVEAETAEMAVTLMHAVGIIIIFMIPGGVLSKGILRGGGDTVFLMIADVGFLWCVSIPLGAAAGLLWNWPPFWILFCLKIDRVIVTFVCLIRFHGKKWIKKIRTNGEIYSVKKA